MTLQFPVAPMKAIAGELPPEDGTWAYEIKWDGMRIVAFVAADGAVTLQSTNLRDVTASFPELWGLAAATGGRPAVLDGEVVAFDDAGRPSFGRLQHRMHLSDPRTVARRAAEVPVAFHVFDLLSFDGTDAIELPYTDRRRLLASVIEPGPTWAVPVHHLGGGAALLEAVGAQGLEGLIAKRLDSTYQPGRRSPAWRKLKVRPKQEFVVGGWAEGEKGRADRIGALLVGYYDGDVLRYAGRVGTGFTDAELDRLAAVFRPLARPSCPFDPPPVGRHRRGAHWVEPSVVAEVAFGEWTADRLLRHPSYLGQREDKDPREVTAAP